jgi:hypothetical protein
MGKLWARTGAVLGACALVLATSMASSSASATAEETANPFGCGVGEMGSNGAYAECTALPKSARVRAEVHCDGFWSNYDRFGPWVSGTQQSGVYCDKTADDRLSMRYNVDQPI